VEKKEVIKPLNFHEKPVLKLEISDPDSQHHDKSDHRLHDNHLSSKKSVKPYHVLVVVNRSKPVKEPDRNDTDNDIQDRSRIFSNFIHFSLLQVRADFNNGRDFSESKKVCQEKNPNEIPFIRKTEPCPMAYV